MASLRKGLGTARKGFIGRLSDLLTGKKEIDPSILGELEEVDRGHVQLVQGGDDQVHAGGDVGRVLGAEGGGDGLDAEGVLGASDRGLDGLDFGV